MMSDNMSGPWNDFVVLQQTASYSHRRVRVHVMTAQQQDSEAYNARPNKGIIKQYARADWPQAFREMSNLSDASLAAAIDRDPCC